MGKSLVVKYSDVELKPYYQDEWVTIYRGDCREILPSLPKVDLVLTDPPYNGDIKYLSYYDSRPWDEYTQWLVGIIKASEEVSYGPCIYFVSKPGLIYLMQAYPPHWVGAWTRGPGNPAGNIRGTLIIPYWEPYLIYGNMGTVYGRIKDWYDIRQNVENINHPCPKPISLMKTIINSGEWQTILDPFCGSGTTLFAAKQLNRHCIGIEIEEKYCEIASNRCRQTVMDFSK